MHKPNVMVCKGDGRAKVAKPVPWEVIEKRKRKSYRVPHTWFCPGQICFIEMGFTITTDPFAVWSIECGTVSANLIGLSIFGGR